MSFRSLTGEGKTARNRGRIDVRQRSPLATDPETRVLLT